MKLSQYIADQKLNDERFAKQVSASKSVVGKWRRGERIPSGIYMRRIVMVTNGAVTANDFFSTPVSV